MNGADEAIAKLDELTGISSTAAISPTGIDIPMGLAGCTVGDTMLHAPKFVSSTSTVAELHTFFEDDHVHAALVVNHHGLLLTVVEREDLHCQKPNELARDFGQLVGRTLQPETDLVRAWLLMTGFGRRRLAVVEPKTGIVLGLLCLKRSGLGFCTDASVAERKLARFPHLRLGSAS